MIYTSDSEEGTLELGRKLSRILPKGTVVALHGDLGAGKTVFSRGFARGLGITEPVTSPTFTVVQEYAIPSGGYFYHLDMYRIADEGAALAFGIDEYLFQPDALTLVEWPERMAGTEVNKRTVEAFIKAGVFDCFGGWRRQYMEVYEKLLDTAQVLHLELSHAGEETRAISIPDEIAGKLL